MRFYGLRRHAPAEQRLLRQIRYVYPRQGFEG